MIYFLFNYFYYFQFLFEIWISSSSSGPKVKLNFIFNYFSLISSKLKLINNIDKINLISNQAKFYPMQFLDPAEKGINT